MLKVTDKQKKALRKTKMVSRVTDEARYVLSGGCLEQGAYMQFGADVNLYGLWEALLYAETYEDKGAYKKGTVKEALQAALAKLGP